MRKPLTAARLAGVVVLLAGVLAFCLVIGASIGTGKVTLWGWIAGSTALSDVDRTILLDVRLPRVLLAALLGGALTVAGVVFQALLRNPLADPYVLGVSGGASIGGVLAVACGLGALAVPALAFLGALGALLLIESIASVGGRLTVYTVLLTGAIFNAFSAALIYLIQSLVSLEELHAIVFYLMGQIPSYGLGRLSFLAVFILAIVAALGTMARDYNVLCLGEEGAAQTGVEVERIKRRTFVLGSLLTAIAVAVAGMIGFVGLVVPHVLRLILGPDHRLLLPAGFLGGAAFLVTADLASRWLISPNELPVGVVTALVGGPFFLYLLRRRGATHGSL